MHPGCKKTELGIDSPMGESELPYSTWMSHDLDVLFKENGPIWGFSKRKPLVRVRAVTIERKKKRKRYLHIWNREKERKKEKQEEKKERKKGGRKKERKGGGGEPLSRQQRQC